MMSDVLSEYEKKVIAAAAQIDRVLDGLDSTEIFTALAKAERVPPGRGIFTQIDAQIDGRMFGELESILPYGIPRLPWDQFFLLHAHLAATRSTCDRGPELFFDPKRRGVGAVLVLEKRIIAGGYNGSPPGAPHCSEIYCLECDWDPTEAEVELISAKANPNVTKNLGPPMCPNCKAEISGGHLIRDGHCVRTIHAEENALLQCALDRTSPAGATVYTTASPCWDCAKRMIRVGVSRLVYAVEYGSRYGLSEDAASLLRDAGVEVEHLEVQIKGR